MPHARQRLTAAAADRSSGSARVAGEAAQAFVRLARELAGARPEAVRAAVTRAARTLIRGQPTMGACLRLADDVLRALEDGGAPAVEDAARAFGVRLEAEKRGLVACLDTYLPRGSTVLTVSLSSTVVRGVSARASRGLRVLCALSEPGGEGRTTARLLRGEGIAAEVIPDSSVAAVASRAALVVLGADAVGPTGFCNRTGSLAAVLGASRAGTLRIVAAGTSKFVDARAWAAVTERMGTRTARAQGTSRVPMFEAVPLRYLSAVVTEDGPLSPSSARALASRSRVHGRVTELM